VQPPTPPPPSQTTRRPPPAERGRSASLIFGVIILVIGLWFFATKTLGLDLPDIEWGTLWPLLVIGLGAWIVFGAMGRNR
jgi:lipopolysaccharide export LptBFGC system permease protein LptF